MIGSTGSRLLFDKFSREANGFSADDAIAAAANILINAVRQSFVAGKMAEAAFDETVARAKEALMGNYDALGRRRDFGPTHQVIRVNQVHVEDGKFFGG